MLIDRIYLRNYRVFEEELELDAATGPGRRVRAKRGRQVHAARVDPVGACGAKLAPPKRKCRRRARTESASPKSRSSTTGHIYLVRRTITGANYTVRAEAQCDGLAIAEGARDTGRYVHSVLGMDDGAFRASVFAEQKQLAAFSSQSPAERRKLVLALLGVTPLDVARDKVRADARQAADQHNRLRGMLPDLEEARVAADDSEARAAAAEIAASEEEKRPLLPRQAPGPPKKSFDALDVVRQEHDILVLEGRAARSELDGATKQVEDLRCRAGRVGRAQRPNLNLLRAQSRPARAAERRVLRLGRVLEAANELAAQPECPPHRPVDEDGLAAADRRPWRPGPSSGRPRPRRQSAAGELERAKEALAKSSSLSGDRGLPPLRAGHSATPSPGAGPPGSRSWRRPRAVWPLRASPRRRHQLPHKKPWPCSSAWRTR